MRPIQKFLLVTLWSAFWAAGAGQAAADDASPWFYRAWQTEDGLPDNNITAVEQTADGYLWVATSGGLLRFNGATFTPFPVIELPGVPSRAVRSMLRDSHSRLWLAMERGPLLCLEPGRIGIYTSSNGVPSQRPIGMAEDEQGALCLNNYLELRRLEDGNAMPCEFPGVMQDGGNILIASDGHHKLWLARGDWLGVLRDGQVKPLFQLKARVEAMFGGTPSGVWICSDGRLFRFEEGNELEDHGPWPGVPVPLTLFEDRTGALWIGTLSEGLFRLAEGKLEKVPTSHPEITCLTGDQEGNLWAGTAGGGLNLIRPRTTELINHAAGLPFDSVQSVCEDSDGEIWAVSTGGSVAHGKPGQWNLVAPADTWAGYKAECVAADRQQGVWIGTRDHGLNYFHSGSWKSWPGSNGLRGSVRSLLVGRNGDVWAAMMGSARSDQVSERLLRIHEGQPVQITKPGRLGAIRAMAETVDGTIWIGTAEGQLMRVQESSLVSEPAIRERITLSIRCLLATPDGSLWIGYAGDGLGRLKDGIHTRVTTANGLLDDYVSQLQADATDTLWIVGNRGLSRVQLSQVEAVMAGQEERVRSRIYGRNDGLRALQPNRDNSPASCRASDGRLWFSTRNGLLVVQADKALNNPSPPPVHLERVSVNDQTVALYGPHPPLPLPGGVKLLDLRAAHPELHVGPDHSKLEFEFAGLSFTSPENVQFRYLLDGFDQAWVEAGSEHHAQYPHLPAGNYEFRVLACNNAGVWNETGATLSLRVSPFFWETWTFKIGTGLGGLLAAGGTVYLFARRRYRRKLSRLEARRAIEQERARIAKDIHDDLGASLTRITLLSQASRGASEEPPGAMENLDEIHATARQLTRSMEEVVWAVNPEHDSFDGLANYMSNYAQSFLRGTGIRCRLELPMQLPASPVTAEVRHNVFLAFKEALNNVVKHAQASEVRISLIPEEAGFVLVIEDNGRGLPAPEARRTAADGSPGQVRGNGLINMNSRLQEIGGTCKLQTSSSGTSLKFTVPLKKTQPAH